MAAKSYCQWNYDCEHCGAPDCIASGAELIAYDHPYTGDQTYYARHREEVSERRKARRGDEQRAKERAYYAAHREHIRERNNAARRRRWENATEEQREKERKRKREQQRRSRQKKKEAKKDD